MIKVLSTIILLFSLIIANFSFAQENLSSSKIYSGYLHHLANKNNASLWHLLFGISSPKEDEIIKDQQCSVEFKSSSSFFAQAVTVIPEKLTYIIRFNHQLPEAFKNFSINIYTKDEDQYSLDPEAEGKQIGINDKHHISDSYLIYIILGSSIDHLEIVSSSEKAGQLKYVLDKLEIKNNPK